MYIFNKTKTYLILLSFTILTGCGGPTCDSDIRSNQWTDCSATKVYSSGTYKGEFKHGDRHGEGEYMFKSGARYVGQFKNGKFEGQGTQYTADNEIIYRGTFVEGKWHGKGEQFVGDESDTISGIFHEDEKWGIYTYTWTSGSQAQFLYQYNKNVGDVFNAQLFEDGSSEAKIVFKSSVSPLSLGEESRDDSEFYFFKGDTYVGSLDKYGQPHEKGTLTTKKGDIYSGFWDRRDFKNGTISFSDGAKYTGEVLNYSKYFPNLNDTNNGYRLRRKSIFHGEGILTTKIGDVYSGFWDRQDFKGKVTCSDGKVYEVQYDDGIFKAYPYSFNDIAMSKCLPEKIETYKLYKREIRNKIIPNIKSPPQEKQYRMQGYIIVGFTILKNGDITGIKLKSKSHIKSINRTAKEIISSSAPFPPIPASLEMESIYFEIPINFE